MPKPYNLIFLITVSTFYLLSCTPENKTQEDNVIHLEDIWSTEGSVMLSEIAGSIEYIPLQMTADQASILPRPSSINVRMTKDHFIIYGRETIVRVFNRQGGFVRAIGAWGKGPGEYLSARQWSIDKDNCQINVGSIFDKKIMSYSIEGDFVGETSIPYPTNYFVSEPSGGYHIASYRQQEFEGKLFRFTRLDEEGAIINRHFEAKVELPKSGIVLKVFDFISSEDKVLVQNAFSDTIYAFIEGEWKPDIFVDFGKFGMPQGWEDDLQNYDDNRANFIERVTLNPEKNYTMIYFSYKGKRYYGMYDHKNSELLFAKNIDDEAEGFINDFDGGPSMKPLSYSEDSNYWYLILQPFDLIELAREGVFDNEDVRKPNKNKALKNLIAGLDENDNPVNMVVGKK